ncbi:MAG: hypothetical protein ABJL33_15440 [Hyphomicrobiales bacterium]
MKSENSHTVSLFSIGNGSIVFCGPKDGRPATQQTVNNVTINNAAIEPTPAYFEATFTMFPSITSGSVALTSSVTLNIPLLSADSDRTYPDVENEAAALLAPTLRNLADLIEEDIADAEERKKARKAAKPAGQ